MAESVSLRGKRLLIVEDEYLVAMDVASALEDLGAHIVGPAGTIAMALSLVEEEGEQLDAAVLDVNLRGERVYPVADRLTAKGVPFVFASGYDEFILPEEYVDAPRCVKPIDKARLARLLSQQSRLH